MRRRMEWKEERVVRKTAAGGVVRFERSTPVRHGRILRAVRVGILVLAILFLLVMLLILSGTGPGSGVFGTESGSVMAGGSNPETDSGVSATQMATKSAIEEGVYTISSKELAGKTTLSVETGEASAVFDEKATDTLQSAAGGNGLTVRFTQTQILPSTGTTAEATGDSDKTGWRLEIQAGNRTITELEKGKLFVRLPCNPNNGTDVNTLVPFVKRTGTNSGFEPIAAGIYRSDRKEMDFIVTGMFTECYVGTQEKRYADVEVSEDGIPHWARASITFLAAREVIDGHPAENGSGTDGADGSNGPAAANGIFDPNGYTTRAQLMKLLAEIEGVDISQYLPADQQAINEALAASIAAQIQEELERDVGAVSAKYGIDGSGTQFRDVPYYEWYAPYVNWAVSRKIASGITYETFDPNGIVSRQQAAVFLKRFVYELDFMLPKEKAEVSFTDQQWIEAYAKDAIKELQMAGIIGGRENGTFDPYTGVTRGEICRMLQTIVEKYVTTSEVSKWYVVEL